MMVDREKVLVLEDIKEECMAVVEEEAVTEAEGEAEVEDVVEPMGRGERSSVGSAQTTDHNNLYLGRFSKVFNTQF